MAREGGGGRCGAGEAEQGLVPESRTPLCLGGRLDWATPVRSWGPQFPGSAGCELGATSAAVVLASCL